MKRLVLVFVAVVVLTVGVFALFRTIFRTIRLQSPTNGEVVKGNLKVSWVDWSLFPLKAGESYSVEIECVSGGCGLRLPVYGDREIVICPDEWPQVVPGCGGVYTIQVLRFKCGCSDRYDSSTKSSNVHTFVWLR